MCRCALHTYACETEEEVNDHLVLPYFLYKLEGLPLRACNMLLKTDTRSATSKGRGDQIRGVITPNTPESRASSRTWVWLIKLVYVIAWESLNFLKCSIALWIIQWIFIYSHWIFGYVDFLKTFVVFVTKSETITARDEWCGCFINCFSMKYIHSKSIVFQVQKALFVFERLKPFFEKTLIQQVFKIFSQCCNSATIQLQTRRDEPLKTTRYQRNKFLWKKEETNLTKQRNKKRKRKQRSKTNKQKKKEEKQRNTKRRKKTKKQNKETKTERRNKKKRRNKSSKKQIPMDFMSNCSILHVRPVLLNN